MRSLHVIPTPRLQHRYLSPEGHVIARTDFSWGEGRLAGEFDGRIKYSGRASNGTDPSEVVWLEKQREDQLRDLGVVVIRWIWNDLFKPARFERLLTAGLRRAQLL
ncbi:hypothetical protein [Dietzia sp. KRD202]|uniref:hypothetical protein n=1 Tax=Dietzia sp. KRD202 TaxID=2729732 RepID=UPI0019D00E95|nr:hypothetical protein [Dietzia sp. KRD202]